MARIRTLTLLGIVALLATLVMLGCEGKTGPTGPAGPQGEQGEQGPPGPVTRTLVTGTVPAGDNAHKITIQGLDMDDPPLISVFVNLTPPEWDELPVPWADTEGNPLTLFASLQDGEITLYNCAELDYIIIILE